MPNHRPWYEDWEAQCERAMAFFHAYRYVERRQLVKKEIPPHFEAEINAFDEFTRLKLIYESNRLERAGLSESDTKKLLLEDETFSDPQKVITITDNLHKNFNAAVSQGKPPPKIIIFGKRKRTALEVFSHSLAISSALFWVNEYQTIPIERELYKRTVADRNAGELSSAQFLDFLNEFEFDADHPPELIPLFSELRIRELHYIMGKRLMPRDAGVDAGFYRVDNRTTDFQIAFPAPENVPKAMDLFVRNANRLMESEENPIVKAAKISYDFVAIHPFPDFNGRMSRLIMNMVLRAEGLPFWAVLRGNKKEKHRYLTALRHANRGKITSYAALIARTVNESFEQLNSNLKKAGLRPIGD
jgi:Fic family protein